MKIPLKLKYRQKSAAKNNPYRPRTGNSHGNLKKRKARKVYGTGK